MKIIYQSNAGVILETDEIKMAIDLFCDAGDLPYTSVSTHIVKAVINREKPYEKIDYMLHTHKHMDHFNAEMVDKYLEEKGKAILIAPYGTLNQLTCSFFEREENIVVGISVGEKEKIKIENNGVSITAYDFKHEGNESADEENIGYLIELDGKRILHVGDACISDENFKHTGLIDSKIDLLIAPFPYITRKDGLAIITKYIRPKKIAVVHLPAEEKDFCGWNRNAYKSAQNIQNQFEDVVLFTKIGQELSI